jgi:hypothetical protein
LSKQIPWRRIFVEGVVIVVSILLAFGLQAWWEGVQERADERALIVDLSPEFSENLRDLRATILLHQGYAVRIDGLGSMTSDQMSAIPPDSLSRYSAAMASQATFDPRTGTLNGAINSGRLLLLSDSDLRGLLTEWLGELDDGREQSQSVWGAGEAVLYRMAELGGPWVNRPLMSGDEFVRLANDEELMGLVRVKLAFAYFYMNRLEALSSLTEQLIAALQEGQ